MVGKTLGHYEILEPLGAGGMGEVYRARDTKLDRDVAIKVLPEDFAADADRLARFEREAKLLASLNHANIAAVYGIEDQGEQRFIAMELVEGETLAEQIARAGRIEVEEALDIARQIAEGLSAAHESGVIHRDLKPANIKITPSGKVKVLDFGLAKAYEPDGLGRADSPDISNSPTMAEATRTGVILGTAAYMSPEQARGKPLDKRADIWSFGCVLYEMLTAAKPFEGETVSDTIAAVLRGEPNWKALPRLATPVRRLLDRCLQKNPERRLRDIGDARIELEDAIAEGPRGEGPELAQAMAVGGNPLLRPAVLLAFSVVGVAGAALGVLASGVLSSESTVGGVIALSLEYPEGTFRANFNEFGRISPDGSMFVVAARDGLLLRRLDELEWTEIDGTRVESNWTSEGVDSPFFSHDGTWIGYRSRGELMRLRVAGGPPESMAPAPGLLAGATWGSDGTIVVGTSNQGLMKLPPDGTGVFEPLTSLDVDENELSHRWPRFLPDGENVLFTIGSVGEDFVGVASIETGEYRRLFPGWSPTYLESGYVIYAQADVLMIVPFDPVSLSQTGQPEVAQEGVLSIQWGSTPNALYSASKHGTLAFVPGSGPSAGVQGRVTIVDGEGNADPLTETGSDPLYPRFTPDGDAVTVSLQRDDRDMWRVSVADADRGREISYRMQGNQFTHAHGSDGTFVFSSENVGGQGGQGLFERAVSGGPEITDLRYSEAVLVAPGSFSPDGSVLALTTIRTDTRGDIVLRPTDGGDPIAFGTLADDERAPVFSSNGLIAYVSDREGPLEVFVEKYPDPEGFQKASSGGGGEPVFSSDGQKLYYRSADGLYVVDVSATEPDLRLSAPRFLFDGPFEPSRVGPANYDVSPNGERFVMIEMTEQTLASSVNVIVNWFDGLMERLNDR